LVVGYFWYSDFDFWHQFHGPYDGSSAKLIAWPRATCYSVWNIPGQHQLSKLVRILKFISWHLNLNSTNIWAVEHQSKASVNHSSPTSSTTVVQGCPGCTSETITDKVLDGHISAIGRSVSYIGSFTERRVCSRDIVMVAAQNNRSLNGGINLLPIPCLPSIFLRELPCWKQAKFWFGQAKLILHLFVDNRLPDRNKEYEPGCQQQAYERLQQQSSFCCPCTVFLRPDRLNSFKIIANKNCKNHLYRQSIGPGRHKQFYRLDANPLANLRHKPIGTV
jgi:hypothetical protein